MGNVIMVSTDSHAIMPPSRWEEYLDPEFHEFLPAAREDNEKFVLFMDGLTPGTIALLVVILAASALMSGLSGFGFSAVGALCLIVLPPNVGVPLLMTLSAANQVMSLRQLKADMKPIKHW